MENPPHTTIQSLRTRELVRLTYNTSLKVVKCQTFQCMAHTLRNYFPRVNFSRKTFAGTVLEQRKRFAVYGYRIVVCRDI